ncbi:MAG: hypothetical protein M3O70_18085, partial [Actinomycetota bacterium]|nr:hypothetical protein [Actinomycetota bacterium]
MSSPRRAVQADGFHAKQLEKLVSAHEQPPTHPKRRQLATTSCLVGQVASDPQVLRHLLDSFEPHLLDPGKRSLRAELRDVSK